jgi:hypothetical protein
LPFTSIPRYSFYAKFLSKNSWIGIAGVDITAFEHTVVTENIDNGLNSPIVTIGEDAKFSY